MNSRSSFFSSLPVGMMIIFSIIISSFFLLLLLLMSSSSSSSLFFFVVNAQSTTSSSSYSVAWSQSELKQAGDVEYALGGCHVPIPAGNNDMIEYKAEVLGLLYTSLRHFVRVLGHDGGKVRVDLTQAYSIGAAVYASCHSVKTDFVAFQFAWNVMSISLTKVNLWNASRQIQVMVGPVNWVFPSGVKGFPYQAISWIDTAANADREFVIAPLSDKDGAYIAKFDASDCKHHSLFTFDKTGVTATKIIVTKITGVVAFGTFGFFSTDYYDENADKAAVFVKLDLTGSITDATKLREVVEASMDAYESFNALIPISYPGSGRQNEFIAVGQTNIVLRFRLQTKTSACSGEQTFCQTGVLRLGTLEYYSFVSPQAVPNAFGVFITADVEDDKKAKVLMFNVGDAADGQDMKWIGEAESNAGSTDGQRILGKPKGILMSKNGDYFFTIGSRRSAESGGSRIALGKFKIGGSTSTTVLATTTTTTGFPPTAAPPTAAPANLNVEFKEHEESTSIDDYAQIACYIPQQPPWQQLAVGNSAIVTGYGFALTGGSRVNKVVRIVLSKAGKASFAPMQGTIEFGIRVDGCTHSLAHPVTAYAFGSGQNHVGLARVEFFNGTGKVSLVCGPKSSNLASPRMGQPKRSFSFLDPTENNKEYVIAALYATSSSSGSAGGIGKYSTDSCALENVNFHFINTTASGFSEVVSAIDRIYGAVGIGIYGYFSTDSATGTRATFFKLELTGDISASSKLKEVIRTSSNLQSSYTDLIATSDNNGLKYFIALGRSNNVLRLKISTSQDKCSDGKAFCVVDDADIVDGANAWLVGPQLVPNAGTNVFVTSNSGNSQSAQVVLFQVNEYPGKIVVVGKALSPSDSGASTNAGYSMSPIVSNDGSTIATVSGKRATQMTLSLFSVGGFTSTTATSAGATTSSVATTRAPVTPGPTAATDGPTQPTKPRITVPPTETSPSSSYSSPTNFTVNYSNSFSSQSNVRIVAGVQIPTDDASKHVALIAVRDDALFADRKGAALYVTEFSQLIGFGTVGDGWRNTKLGGPLIVPSPTPPAYNVFIELYDYKSCVVNKTMGICFSKYEFTLGSTTVIYLQIVRVRFYSSSGSTTLSLFHDANNTIRDDERLGTPVCSFLVSPLLSAGSTVRAGFVVVATVESKSDTQDINAISTETLALDTSAHFHFGAPQEILSACTSYEVKGVNKVYGYFGTTHSNAMSASILKLDVTARPIKLVSRAAFSADNIVISQIETLLILDPLAVGGGTRLLVAGRSKDIVRFLTNTGAEHDALLQDRSAVFSEPSSASSIGGGITDPRWGAASLLDPSVAESQLVVLSDSRVPPGVSKPGDCVGVRLFDADKMKLVQDEKIPASSPGETKKAMGPFKYNFVIQKSGASTSRNRTAVVFSFANENDNTNDAITFGFFNIINNTLPAVAATAVAPTTTTAAAETTTAETTTTNPNLDSTTVGPAVTSTTATSSSLFPPDQTNSSSSNSSGSDNNNNNNNNDNNVTRSRTVTTIVANPNKQNETGITISTTDPSTTAPPTTSIATTLWKRTKTPTLIPPTLPPPTPKPISVVPEGPRAAAAAVSTVAGAGAATYASGTRAVIATGSLSRCGGPPSSLPPSSSSNSNSTNNNNNNSTKGEDEENGDEDSDLEPLGPDANPLGLSLGDGPLSTYRACIVGSCILSLGFIFGSLFVAFCMWQYINFTRKNEDVDAELDEENLRGEDGKKMSEDEKVQIKEERKEQKTFLYACSRTMCPGICAVPIAILSPVSLYSAGAILSTHEKHRSGGLDYGLVALSFIYDLFLPLGLFLFIWHRLTKASESLLETKEVAEKKIERFIRESSGEDPNPSASAAASGASDTCLMSVWRKYYYVVEPVRDWRETIFVDQMRPLFDRFNAPIFSFWEHLVLCLICFCSGINANCRQDSCCFITSGISLFISFVFLAAILLMRPLLCRVDMLLIPVLIFLSFILSVFGVAASASKSSAVSIREASDICTFVAFSAAFIGIFTNLVGIVFVPIIQGIQEWRYADKYGYYKKKRRGGNRFSNKDAAGEGENESETKKNKKNNEKNNNRNSGNRQYQLDQAFLQENELHQMSEIAGQAADDNDAVELLSRPNLSPSSFTNSASAAAAVVPIPSSHHKKNEKTNSTSPPPKPKRRMLTLESMMADQAEEDRKKKEEEEEEKKKKEQAKPKLRAFEIEQKKWEEEEKKKKKEKEEKKKKLEAESAKPKKRVFQLELEEEERKAKEKEEKRNKKPSSSSSPQAGNNNASNTNRSDNNVVEQKPKKRMFQFGLDDDDGEDEDLLLGEKDKKKQQHRQQQQQPKERERSGGNNYYDNSIRHSQPQQQQQQEKQYSQPNFYNNNNNNNNSNSSSGNFHRNQPQQQQQQSQQQQRRPTTPRAGESTRERERDPATREREQQQRQNKQPNNYQQQQPQPLTSSSSSFYSPRSSNHQQQQQQQPQHQMPFYSPRSSNQQQQQQHQQQQHQMQRPRQELQPSSSSSQYYDANNNYNRKPNNNNDNNYVSSSSSSSFPNSSSAVSPSRSSYNNHQQQSQPQSSSYQQQQQQQQPSRNNNNNSESSPPTKRR